RDRHGKDGRFKTRVPVADEKSEAKEHPKEEEQPKKQAASSALAFLREDLLEETADEEGGKEKPEVEEDPGDAGEPPGEEVPGAEGGGADVEVQVLAAHPEIDALPGAEAGLLPLHGRDLEVRDLPSGDTRLHEVVEVHRGGGEAFNQGVPVVFNLGE